VVDAGGEGVDKFYAAYYISWLTKKRLNCGYIVIMYFGILSGRGRYLLELSAMTVALARMSMSMSTKNQSCNYLYVA
jgi:hypothetical protein